MRERTCKACGSRLGETAHYCKRCGAPAFAGRNPFLSSAWFLIPGGTVLAAIVLFSGVRMFLQLAAGTFPSEGFYLSAGIAVVVSALAFAFSRLWAVHAAGLNDARYRRALWAAQTSSRRAPRGIARPVLLAVFLLTAAAAAAALLVKPAEKSESEQETAVGAESASNSDASAGQQAAAANAEYDSVIKVSGIWTAFTDEISDGLPLQNFIAFDDEQAVFGSCVDSQDVITSLSGGSPAYAVTYDATYSYEVTAASFIDVRDMDSPYIAAAEIVFHDPSGESEPFTATLTFYHVLYFTSGPVDLEYANPYPMYSNVGNAFSFDPAKTATLPEAAVETPALYGLWVAAESYDSFASFDVHTGSDIPFLFFDIETLYTGTCASAADARNFMLTLSETDNNCVITGTYPFVGENMTYVLRDGSDLPDIDTCDITVKLDEMSAVDLYMEGGAITDWQGIAYLYSNGVEWSAPW